MNEDIVTDKLAKILNFAVRADYDYTAKFEKVGGKYELFADSGEVDGLPHFKYSFTAEQCKDALIKWNDFAKFVNSSFDGALFPDIAEGNLTEEELWQNIVTFSLFAKRYKSKISEAGLDRHINLSSELIAIFMSEQMGKLEYRKGDLFEQQDLKVLAQGVNCKGLSGAGIAVPFSQMFPEMNKEYVQLCKNKELLPGGVFVWDSRDDSTQYDAIFNLASQYKPGADAREDYLFDSLKAAANYAVEMGYDMIGLPLIGGGIGGLYREQVISVLRKVAAWNFKIKLVLVELG